MKTSKLNNILRILFIVLSTLFLLTACGDDDGATPLPKGDAREAANIQCWQRDFLNIFFDVAGRITKRVYDDLTKDNLLNVVVIGFSIWMMFQMLKHLASPSPESVGEFWTRILKKGFLCVFCGYLVLSTEQIYYVLNTFIFPIYMTILEFTSEILKATSQDPSATAGLLKFESTLEDYKEDGIYCEVYQYSLGDCSALSGSLEFSDGKMPEAPKQMMGCMVCAVNDRLSSGYNISLQLMKLASLTAAMAGIFLFVCFSIAKLGFVFYLVDSIFRMNMMLILLPFFIMAYPFEQIRKWSVTGFKYILHSSAIMMCLGVIVTMTIYAMHSMISNTEFPAASGFGDEAAYNKWTTVPLAMIFMGFVIVKCSGMAVELAGKITGADGDSKFARKIKQIVAMVAKVAITVVSLGSGRVVTKLAEHFEKIRRIQEKVRKAKEKVQKIRNKVNAIAGRKSGQGGGNDDEQ